MASVCPKDKVLEPGADLWVVTDLDESEWSQKIDWYLNFQLVRSSIHKVPDQSSELQDVIKKWEFDPPDVEISKQSPLMVASSDLLPNHSTVLIPLGGDVKAWAKRVFDLWKKLDEPSLRVFLPKNIDAKSFGSAWPGSAHDIDGALVSEI
jgi:hypothetical protein